MRHHLSSRAIVGFATAASLLLTSDTLGVTAEWTNPDGGGWNDQTNWSTGQYPDGQSYEVVLGPMGQPYTVDNRSSIEVGYLSISDPAVVLKLDFTTNGLRAYDGITNHGAIEISRGQDLRIGSTSNTVPSHLMGAGVVRFLTEKNGSTSYGQYLSFAAAEGTTDPHVIGPDMTIHAVEGFGSMYSAYSVPLENQGLLWADGHPLNINQNLTNTGTLRVSNGGELTAHFTDGGLAGTLDFDSGGTIALGGKYQNAYTLNQSVYVPPGSRFVLVDDWTITSGQTISVDQGRFDMHTDRPGLSDVVFNGGTLGIGYDTDWPALQARIPANVSQLLLTSDHIGSSPNYSGDLDLAQGNLDLSALPYEFGLEAGTLRNGMIHASLSPSEPLLVDRGGLQNMQVAVDVHIENNLTAEDVTLQGVRVSGNGTLDFQSSVLLDQVELDCDWNAYHYSDGHIVVVNGLKAGGGGQISPRNPLTFIGNQRVDGSGVIQVYGGRDPGWAGNISVGPGVLSVSQGDLTIGEGISIDIAYDNSTIQATGRSLVFEGDLIVDYSYGYSWGLGTSQIIADTIVHYGLITMDEIALDITADAWSLADTAELEVDLDLDWPTLIDVTGVAEIDGDLTLTIDPDWTPALGESITLINAVGGITGHFDAVQLPGGLSLDYSPTALTVSVRQPGDLDGDGFVGLGDLDKLLQTWNQNVLAGSWAHGDMTGDGFVGLDELDLLLQNWNAGTPPGGVASSDLAPEPSALLILGSTITGVLLRRCPARPMQLSGP